MSFSKTITLNSGHKIPILGLGTWGSPPGQVVQAVKDAIDAGYRHIDGAHVYENENEVGQGINQKIKEGVIKREDIFVTSKLWNTFHRSDLVQGGCEKTLKDLGLDYIDLYLIHWPMAFKEEGELFPRGDDKVIFSNADFVATWKEMEKLVEKGLVRSIGISNFNKRQIERLLENSTIKPATNQVECHPYLNQKKLQAFCESKGIVLTAYSPLGAPNRPWVKDDDVKLLDDPKVVATAGKYKKTPAQILIRYQIQRGNIVIPKSVTKERIISNFDVFNFELSAEDFASLDNIDNNIRFVQFFDAFGHPEHPFEKDEY